MLIGRLGLETARVPHADRHGLVWLAYGNLYVRDGTLRFVASASEFLDAGDYAVPFQAVSMILLGPGSTVTHDALRLLARHGTGLVAVGEGGVRCYSAPPLMPDRSQLARRQVELWADERKGRPWVARRMYAWRFGEVLPHGDLDVLRGIEGARIKESYRALAKKYGVPWAGRRYDRSRPEAADLPNQAINHAATAIEGAAMIAVASTGTIPQLGFIHEDSGISFVLDIADLFRTEVTVPVAFRAVRDITLGWQGPIERRVRQLMAETLRKEKVIPKMIDRIKELFGGGDRDP